MKWNLQDPCESPARRDPLVSAPRSRSTDTSTLLGLQAFAGNQATWRLLAGVERPRAPDPSARMLQLLAWSSPATAPALTFDHGFLDDGKGNIDNSKRRAPGVMDQVQLAKWRSKLYAAQVLRPDLGDATRAYEHFLDGGGANLAVNYDNFLKEDNAGHTVLASAQEDAVAGAIDLDNGWRQAHPAERTQDRTFNMGSDAIGVGGSDGRYPYPNSENWAKAIGAHSMWVTANVTVTVDPAAGTRSVWISLTLHMEDMYNFNPGAHDIATDIPDSDNGLFEITGLGHEFKSTGTAYYEVVKTDIPLDGAGATGTPVAGYQPRGPVPQSDGRSDRD